MNIKVHCKKCKTKHDGFASEDEFPPNVSHLECNFCPLCEDEEQGSSFDYEEKVIYKDPMVPESITSNDPNQLKLEL